MHPCSTSPCACRICLQASTARLGGLLVSMFFGLRLIGSVIASKIVLGVTIVQEAVQVGGPQPALACARHLHAVVACREPASRPLLSRLSPPQVVGIVFVSLAVLGYTGLQWRSAQAAGRQWRRQAAAAAAGEQRLAGAQGAPVES